MLDVRYRKLLFMMIIAVLVGLPTQTWAIINVNVPISDLTSRINGSVSSDGQPLKQYAIEQLQKEINNAGLVYTPNQIIGVFNISELQQDVGCSPIRRVILSPTTASLTMLEGTGFNLDVDGLKNAELQATLVGSAETNIPVEIQYAVKIPFINKCYTVYRSNGHLRVSMHFSSDLTFHVDMTPSYDADNTAIVVDKRGLLTGSVNFTQVDLQPDFGDTSLTNLLINVFEPKLRDSLKSLGTAEFTKLIGKTNNRLDGKDVNGNFDPNITNPFNSPTVYNLPAEIKNDSFRQTLIQEFNLPDVLFDSLSGVEGKLLYELFVGDAQTRSNALAAFGAGVACEAINNKYAINLPNVPIYSLNSGSCAVASLSAPDQGRYYSDPDCINEIAFRPADFADFCQAQLGPDAKQLLGNAASWQPDFNQANDPLPSIASQKWTSVPSSQFDMGVISKTGTNAPFMKRIKYKTITGLPRGTGTCELEMRIYKSSISATGLKPLLALHGGTWQGRGFSFLGLEATSNFLTQRGFIVFAPFYRLANDSNANIECNGAGWRDITEDVQDALDWVKVNGPKFGATSDRVALFGQSAGAHLSAWLATENSLDISKSFLLYPPVDVIDFLQGVSDGRYTAYKNFGLKSLAILFGAQQGQSEVNLELIDLAGINVRTPPQSLAAFIPDSTFNLGNLDVFTPPRYLQYCAAKSGVSLQTLNLSLPPAALMTCLKEELSEFILSSSFIHKVGILTAPSYLIQGTADVLVPFQQSELFCSQVSGVEIPTNLSSLPTRIHQSCGPQLNLDIVQGAEHMLDFGMCVGRLCPAGQPGSATRQAVADALTEGFDWLTQADTSGRNDSDMDGLVDVVEVQLGTDPLNPDTDGDGMNDGDEVAINRNPLVPDNI